MKNGADTQVVITVSGPDEDSCRLRPLGTVFKEELPGMRICVALVPSAGATDADSDILRNLPFIDAVSNVTETNRMLIQKRLPEGFDHFSAGIVLHLGGDPLMAWLIAKRFGQPCFAYVDRPSALQSRFDRVFYSGVESSTDEGESRERNVIGELAVDAAQLLCPKREPFRGGKITVGIYPGSRAVIASEMLPFFGAVVDRVSKAMPGIEWMLAKSEYLSTEFLREMPTVDGESSLEGESLHWKESDGKAFLLTEQGNRIEVASPGAVATRANLALTVPESNTAELAALGVPMVVTLPNCLIETAPLEDLAEHAGRIPVVGPYVSRSASHFFPKKNEYHSLPNRRSRQMLVPELVGEIRASQVAAVVIQTLTSETRRMEEELRTIMGPPGAAMRLAEELRLSLEARKQGAERAAAG